MEDTEIILTTMMWSCTVFGLTSSRKAVPTFVLWIQSKFQRDCFFALGNDFVSINVTHNATQYTGILHFALLVRDLWGHGTLCHFVVYLHLWMHYRCSCHLDVVVRQHGSNSQFFFEFCKFLQPSNLACNNDDLQQSTNECYCSCVSGHTEDTVLVACALCHLDTFLHGTIPGTLGTHLHLGKNWWMSESLKYKHDFCLKKNKANSHEQLPP